MHLIGNLWETILLLHQPLLDISHSVDTECDQSTQSRPSSATAFGRYSFLISLISSCL